MSQIGTNYRNGYTPEQEQENMISSKPAMEKRRLLYKQQTMKSDYKKLMLESDDESDLQGLE